MTRGRAGTAGRAGKAGRAGAVSVLAFGALMLVPGPAGAASPDGPDGMAPYETSPDAEPVRGTPASTDGPRLRPGTYTDTIARGEKKYYRVALDAKSNAFVSTVLAPPPGIEVGSTDGIRVLLESTDGVKCSNGNDVTFGGGSSRPIADYATRRIEADRSCQSAGDYLYSVEWTGSGNGPGDGGWPVELTYMTEPGLRAGAVMPSEPATWNSQAPSPSAGRANSVSGGSGFNDAPAVGGGAWKDKLSPGESRFYKVPVEWGQQLFLDAEFANSTNDEPPLVFDGLRLGVFNTARGFVASASANYQGKPAAVSLGTAPAAFSNRSSPQDATAAMRFSGWYYVRVSLDRRVDSALPVTLRVGLKGEPQPGPPYDGDATAAGFGITDEDREAAAEGRIEDTDGQSVPLKAIGFAGIGLGTALVLGLVLWTVLGRRGRGAEASRASAPAPMPASREH
ncbi:hypothetical protein OG883_04015 [Streptomyces sp. NBC_01142]|uniref:hypothetical protein n=1 Tax=Streptomyces sp. NBC_01142 TaxID=2975865 RepID=UPI002251762D|nr:hypothetical protein [Streptomyces sp. NBC_01142]MCX4819082.1 hypothetical protein [Streptomyces sp. NBC_01142]